MGQGQVGPGQAQKRWRVGQGWHGLRHGRLRSSDAVQPGRNNPAGRPASCSGISIHARWEAALGRLAPMGRVYEL